MSEFIEGLLVSKQPALNFIIMVDLPEMTMQDWGCRCKAAYLPANSCQVTSVWFSRSGRDKPADQPLSTIIVACSMNHFCHHGGGISTCQWFITGITRKNPITAKIAWLIIDYYAVDRAP